MATYYVDLNASIIDKNRQVYVARPGRRYSLYLDFLEQSVVFPELPGLDLDRSKPFKEQEDLDAKILRAREIQQWIRRPSESEPPNRELEIYREKAGGRGLSQLRGIVAGYFDRMAVGDLVVVPPSSFSQDALIGELTTGPDKIISAYTKQYDGETFDGRSVRWLARIPKKKLPASMLDALEKPIALYILEKSLRDVIYEAAYGNYIDMSRDDFTFSSRFSVSNAEYTTQDDLRLLAFLNIVAANLSSADRSGVSQDIFAALTLDLGEYAPDLRTNINSPGFLTLFSRKGTPIVAAVLFSLAVSVGAAAVDSGGTVMIGNSKAQPGDACTALVAERALRTLELLGLDSWPLACEAARKAADAAGITTTTTVTQRP